MAELDPAWAAYEAPPQDVSARILSLIRRHELGPGAPLPTEAELSRLLRTSRSSVREAVKTLSALDVVEVRHGHGSYVGPLTLAPLRQLLVLRAQLDPTSAPAQLSEMVRVLHDVESGLAGAIFAGLTDEHRDALTTLAALIQERAGLAAPFQDACRSFHRALLAPVASGLGGQLATTLWDVATVIAAELAAGPAFVGMQLRVVAETHHDLATAAGLGPAQLRSALSCYYVDERPPPARPDAP